MNKKKIIEFGLVLIIIGLFFFLTSKINPEEIVGIIGLQNIYLVIFALATLGGVSFLTATSFYAALATIAAGGGNPLLLALFAAPGILIGDFLFWYIGLRSKNFLERNSSAKSNRFSAWLSRKPSWLVSIFIYLYTGFTPLPGDALMLALAMSGFKFKEILIPTILGNFTLSLVIAIAASKDFALFNFFY